MQTSHRYVNVDGLRLLCALAVLLFHYVYRGSLEGLYAPLLPWPQISDPAKYGHIGVHIFFCISGFVIAYSAAGRSAFEFAVSRFARIYPTFILCLTLLFAVRLMWGAPELPTSVTQYAANFAMLPKLFGQNFMSGVYWSIVVELCFYAWVFVLLLTGLFQRFPLWIVGIWLLVAAANEVWLGHGAVRMVFITEFAPYFAFGMLLQRVQAEQRLTPVIGLMIGFAVALGVAVLLRETTDIRTSFHIPMSDSASIGLLLTGMLFLIWAVEVKRPILRPMALAWAGGVSYPLYLLHEGLGQVAFVRWRGMMDGVLLFVAVAAGVIVLATAVWWWFDRHAVPGTRKILMRLALPQFSAFRAKPSVTAKT